MIPKEQPNFPVRQAYITFIPETGEIGEPETALREAAAASFGIFPDLPPGPEYTDAVRAEWETRVSDTHER